MTSRDGNQGDETQLTDSISHYHAILEESATRYPLATEALMRADRDRLRRWKQFIDPIDLRAIELLLDNLLSTSDLLASSTASHKHRLARLPQRIADDVRMSLEGLLSGYLQVASDAMRDIIETELLIRDLALDPSRIAVWANASDDVLRRNFQPVHMRQRQASALGVAPKDVPGATDYAAHSKILHVGQPLFPRSAESGARAGHRVLDVLNALTDIMWHGTSSLRALRLLSAAVRVATPDPELAIAALDSSSDDLHKAHSAIEAIERNTLPSLNVGENGAGLLFESGLMIVIHPDAAKVDFYRTNRTDFRTFHRGVTAENSALISMTSLGSSPRKDLILSAAFAPLSDRIGSV
jgi:hypothetical protein